MADAGAPAEQAPPGQTPATKALIELSEPEPAPAPEPAPEQVAQGAAEADDAMHDQIMAGAEALLLTRGRLEPAVQAAAPPLTKRPPAAPTSPYGVLMHQRKLYGCGLMQLEQASSRPQSATRSKVLSGGRAPPRPATSGGSPRAAQARRRPAAPGSPRTPRSSRGPRSARVSVGIGSPPADGSPTSPSATWSSASKAQARHELMGSAWASKADFAVLEGRARVERLLPAWRNAADAKLEPPEWDTHASVVEHHILDLNQFPLQARRL